MRVIAGTLKGRPLEAPTWAGLRPTSDKLRETIFNMLAPRVVGARVLDGFAGTGALGIEALSRGAETAVFIEHDRRARALIERNVSRCGLEAQCTVVPAPFARGLATVQRTSGFVPFDLVLLDPPYGSSLDESLQDVDTVLADSGVVVLEHAARQAAPNRVGGLRKTRDRRSGDSALTFYEKRGGDAD